GRDRDLNVGYAGCRRRIRIRTKTTWAGQRTHARGAGAFQLSEAIVALRAAAPARSARSGVRESRGGGDPQDTRTQPRARVRTLHQLPADAHGARPGLVRSRLSDSAARHGTAQRAARRVSRDTALRALRDVVVLAGHRRAGGAVELRYHR